MTSCQTVVFWGRLRHCHQCYYHAFPCSKSACRSYDSADSEVLPALSQVVRRLQSNSTACSSATAESDHMSLLSIVCYQHRTAKPLGLSHICVLVLFSAGSSGGRDFAVIQFVDHCVLCVCLSEQQRHGHREVNRVSVFTKDLHLL